MSFPRGAALVVVVGSFASCNDPAKLPADAGETAPLPSATASPTPTASALLDIAPRESLERMPLIAVRQWTQGVLDDVPDIPQFTLYDDGSVVAWRKRERRFAFVHAKLAAAERDELVRSAASSGFLALAREYRGEVLKTHVPTTTILLRQPGGWKGVTVVGFLDGKMIEGETHRPPPEFADLYERLMGYPLPNAEPWQYPAVRVLLDVVQERGRAWPAGLPTPGAERFPPGDATRIFYATEKSHEAAARAAIDAGSYRFEGKSWRVRSVAPTLREWTYLERITYCSQYPTSCR